MYSYHFLFYSFRHWYNKLTHLFMFFAASISAASATPITFQFEGEITKVDTPLAEFFYPGKKFTLTYTFESNTPNQGTLGFFNYPEAINKMTFTSDAYTAFANKGTIALDLEDGAFTSNYSLGAVLSPKLGDYVPDGISSSWNITTNAKWDFIPEIDENGPPEHPHFLPDISPIDRCLYCPLYDADGNIVYDPFTSGLVGSLQQPLYNSAGNPVPVIGNNGFFRLSFLNEAEQSSNLIGRLISGIVVTDPIDNALLAYWPLHDGDGPTAFDYSGNKQDGVIHNEPEWQNNLLYFHGDDEYIYAGYLDVPGEALTLTAWVKSEDFANCPYNGCRIITKSYHTSNPAQFWMMSTVLINNETHLRFSLKTNGETSHLYATGDNIKENEWMHVAAVYDGVNMYLYKNGREVGRLPKTGPIETNDMVPVWIGGNPFYVNTRPWKGNIANVRIYQKALTVDEIKAIRDKDRSSILD